MRKILLMLGLLLFAAAPVFAFQKMEDVKIEIVPVSEHISMLQGQGGNIGVLTGPDGTVMIDDQFAPLSEKIMGALKKLGSENVRFLVNTHFHGDHTGGNANFEQQGALILAHDNVRKRLKEDEKNPEGKGLPIITFDKDITLHLNNNDILVTHVHNAHTDSDAMVYFPQDNVLHTGDTFFNGMFPYIDLKSGGSVAGDIEAGEKGLLLINKNTKIIPGHGKLANYQEYKDYLEMLKGIRDNVKKAIAAGKNREEVIKEERLTSQYFTDEAVKDGFINGPKIRETFFDSLTATEDRGYGGKD
ncbi:MAG: MBL fold metallo-hydrolase [Gillisia sp.]